MSTIFEVAELWDKLDVEEISTELIKEHSSKILDIQKDQLYQGKTNQGSDIRPFYSEDPFFKKPGAAQKYIAWKQKITPDSRRNPDAPNLFIIGSFYKSIKGKIEIDGLSLYTDSTLGHKITSKFSNILGLNEDSIQEYIEKHHKEEFNNRVRKNIGLD